MADQYFHTHPEGEDLHQSSGQYGPGVYYMSSPEDAGAQALSRGHSTSPISVQDSNSLTLQPDQNLWNHPDLWSDIDGATKSQIMNAALRSGDWAPMHTLLRAKAYQGVRRLGIGGQIDNGMVMSPTLANTTASSDMVLAEKKETKPLVPVIHFSNKAGLNSISPDFYKTPGGINGRDNSEIPMTFAYEVGTPVEKLVQNGTTKAYSGAVDPESIYDIADDPEGFVERAAANPDALRAYIKAAGFHGLKNSGHKYHGSLQLFQPLPVQEIAHPGKWVPPISGE